MGWFSKNKETEKAKKTFAEEYQEYCASVEIRVVRFFNNHTGSTPFYDVQLRSATREEWSSVCSTEKWDMSSEESAFKTAEALAEYYKRHALHRVTKEEVIKIFK